jgi:squalene-associated FAD-dependent desaturase
MRDSFRASSSPHVAVIGGGCAGLAAAASLAQQGIPVTLLESSHQLGGRTRGINWKGLRLDNGQHILLGAYSATLRLLTLAGVDLENAVMRLPLQLTMHGSLELHTASHLPAPLHMLAGILQARGLSLGEKWAALRFMVWLRRIGFRLSEDENLRNLLTRKQQPQKLTKLLWEPLCLAALNTPINQASAQVFLNVLRDSFSKSRTDSDMLLPRCDLSTLIADPLAAYIRRAGGQVLTNTTVISLGQDGDGFLLDCDGRQIQRFSHVIIAVSPFRLAQLAQHLPALAEIAHVCEKFSYQPIYTVYVQYPESVKLDNPLIGFTQGYGQWVFDRGLLCGQPGLLAVVISAEGPHQKLTQEALAAEIIVQLATAFPALPQALWHKVVAEKRATFACIPDLQRPQQRTSMDNLYLAGDYTAGDYPATIEGAIRSGVTCADHVISALG